MCGIFALIKQLTENSDKKLLSRQEIKSINKKIGFSLTQRGPDLTTPIIDKETNSLFIFYRLSIMDTSSNGNQPFRPTEGRNIIMLCNGEIYNYKKLIKEHNLICYSDSDSEVILRLYEKYNDFNKIVSLLDGVYAILLFDNKELFLARDRIGVRPLFYSNLEKELAVSSLVKPITNLGNPKLEINEIMPGMIYHWKNIEDIPIITPISFPQLPERYKITNMEKAIKDVRNILTHSVSKRIDCDRPIACLLSGGLDSTIVAAILCKLIGSDRVRTYSIGMKGGTDLKYAKIAADFLKTKHTEVFFTEEEGLEAIEEVIEAIESYDITTVRASVPMYLLSKYISNETDDIVVFSGEGADELFCGYLYFHNAPTPQDAKDESTRLIKQLYKYDVLRADRTVSANGLEFREPFLDNNLVEFALQLSGEMKQPQDGWEKLILRKAFEDILPPEVAWRRKEGFSDGNSSLERPWKDCITEYVDTIIDDEEFNNNSEFMSKEQLYYRLLFDIYFPNYDVNIVPWMPKWSGNLTDPSGRLIKAFDEK
jgi:asparagine synthase (glutamine-hydrolysing)